MLRDVTRLCDYFNRQGLPVDAAEMADTLWRTSLRNILAGAIRRRRLTGARGCGRGCRPNRSTW